MKALPSEFLAQGLQNCESWPSNAIICPQFGTRCICCETRGLSAELPPSFAEDQAVPHGIAQMDPTEVSQNQSLSSAETDPSAETTSSDWNFRRSGRSQRSAREWRRVSTLNLSDWDNLQPSQSQHSDAVSPDLQDNAGRHPLVYCLELNKLGLPLSWTEVSDFFQVVVWNSAGCACMLVSSCQ